MPVAGSYRSIDFVLSNMTNSHIQNVAVFTQYNSRSLNEHLSSSKWWDFGRKQGGLYVFTPTITCLLYTSGFLNGHRHGSDRYVCIVCLVVLQHNLVIHLVNMIS